MQILKLLGGGDGISLEEIAKTTGYPKSSSARILETLCSLGMAEREAATKKFRALFRLVPCFAGAGENTDRLIHAALSRLAALSGFTAEYHVPVAEGMLLLMRAEPPGGEDIVWAREGYTLPWDGAMTAISVLGNALFRGTQKSSFKAGWILNAAAADGKTPVGRSEVLAMIREAAKKGWAADRYFNKRGVLRVACPLNLSGIPHGVLALALTYRPGIGNIKEEMLKLLRSHSDITIQTRPPAT